RTKKKVKLFILFIFGKFVKKFMKNSFFTSKSSIIRAIIALIIGILAIALPSITLEYLIITIGLLLLLGCVLFIIMAIRTQIKNERNILIVQSIINLVLGLLFIFFPNPVASIFIILLSIILIILGVFLLSSAFFIRRLFRWPWFTLIISILVIISGIVMLINPFDTARAVLIFLGIIL